MPIARFQMPDGRVARFEVPDGTTPEQAQAMIALTLQKQPAKPQAEDPGFGQTLLIGAGRTFDRIGKGAQQLYYGIKGDEQKQAELAKQAAEDDAAYKPLQELRPWATGIGEALPAMAIPGGGAATMIGNAGRMAAAGAIPGMLEYGSLEERAKRGALGAMAGAAVPVAGATAKTAWAFAEPLMQSGRDAIIARTLNRVAGPEAKAAAQRMAQAQELVPGSIPTAAQVAENGGIAALERAAAAANPAAYTQRGMEQASARLQALRGIAKDQGAKDAQQKLVDDTARSLYGQAFTESIDNTPELVKLMSRRSMRAAEGRALGLANEGNFPFVATLDNLTPKYVPIGGKAQPAIIDAPMMVKDPAFGGLGVKTEQRGLLDAGFQPKQDFFEVPPLSTVPVRDMHTIKMGMDALLSDRTLGIAGREADAIKATREKLLNMLPESYQTARQAHIDLNRPIHQMDIGSELMRRVSPALADFGAMAKETGATYAKALRDGDAIAKEVTGLKNSTMAGIMTPEQMDTLTNIAKDIARKANAQDLGRGTGSDTVQKLAMNNIAAQSGMPRVVGGLLDMPGIGRGMSWVYRNNDEQMLSQLADVMLDPKKASALMTTQQRKWLEGNPVVRRVLEQAAVRPALAAPTLLANPSQ